MFKINKKVLISLDNIKIYLFFVKNLIILNFYKFFSFLILKIILLHSESRIFT